MPQASAASTTKHNVNSSQPVPKTLLKSKRVPSNVVVGVETKNLAKCVNRQLQAPSKCQKRIYIRETSTANNTTFIRQSRSKIPSKSKHLNYVGTPTCPPTFRCLTPPCRKSHSMIELSPAQLNSEDNNNLRSETDSGFVHLGQLAIKTNISSLMMKSRNNLWRVQESKDNADQLLEISRKAASVIYQTLILNAWRHRRQEVKDLHGTVQQLLQQIEHFQLQIIVLRRLLECENNRVGQLGTEIHSAKAQLENTIKEKTELSAKKETLENEIKALREVSEERMLKSENWKNELLSTKSQLKAVEVQIERDREKLSKLREDKKILLEKVLTNESLAAERGGRAEQAEIIAKELRDKIGTQICIINKLQDEKHQLTRKLQEVESEKIQLKKCLSESNDTEKTLSLQAVDLRTQLSDREAALRRIELAYNTQLIELNALRGQLVQQSQQTGWSGRILQIAGNMVRAPRAILRTFSFLSLFSVM